jgi:hypothetical protein
VLRHLGFGLLTFALVVGVIGTSEEPAWATPFTCASTTYQITVNQLKVASFDLSLDPSAVTYADVGSANAHQINAIGYNYDDNYVWGIENRTSPTANRLLRIGSDGSRMDLGPVSGLPASNYIAGDYDGSGNLIVSSNLGAAYRVNLSTQVATSLGTLSPAPSDFAIINNSKIPGSGRTSSVAFYTRGTDLYSFDPTSATPVSSLVGALTLTGQTSTPQAISGGAMWADVEGRVIAFDNTTGRYFLIADPLTSPLVAESKAIGVALTSNDGAFCMLATYPIPLPDDSDDSAAGAELPAGPRIALDFRGVAGQPSEGAVVGVSGLNIPDGSVATVSLCAPEVKLFDQVPNTRAFERAVALPAGLTPGSSTVVYRVVLPSGEVLALHVVVGVGAGGVITSVSQNVVGLPSAGACGDISALADTGVRSSSVPWWAIITIFGGLALIIYSRRLVTRSGAVTSRSH